MADANIWENDPIAKDLAESVARMAASNSIQPESISPKYKILRRAIRSGGVNVALYGAPQTGKTTAAIKIFAEERPGLPVIVIPCSAGMRESDFIGYNTINDKGLPEYKPAPFAHALGAGWGVILDEFTKLQPSVGSALLPLLSGSDTFVMKDGKILHKHPDFQCIVTGNHLLLSSLKRDSALNTRFKAIAFEDLAQKPFIMMASAKWPNMSTTFHQSAYELSRAVMDVGRQNGAADVSCGIRQLDHLLIPLANQPIPLDEFMEEIRSSFLGVLDSECIRTDVVNNFYNTPIIQKRIKELYQFYCESIGDTSGDNPQNSPQGLHGMSAFEQMYGRKGV